MLVTRIKKLISYFIFPCVLIILLAPTYLFYVRTLPFQYWDEVYWVGRSYYYEFFTVEDITGPWWQKFEAYDQPNLANILFGLWLSNKFSNEIDYSIPKGYTSLLLQAGFPTMEESLANEFVDTSRIDWIEEDSWTDRYTYRDLTEPDTEFVTALRMIYQARLLNMILLLTAVLVAYYFMLRFMHPLFGGIGALFYGLNLLLLKNSLLAHSEALFLLTFNMGLLVMLYYFTQKQRLRYLILFSIIIGLCGSTKLNGFMLLILYSGVYLTLLKLKIISKPKYEHIFLPFVISYFVFLILNPYLYLSPIDNFVKMFTWRMNTANHSLPLGASAPSQIEIIFTIYQNFFSNQKSEYFSGYTFTTTFPFIQNFMYLTIFGFAYLMYQILKKKKEVTIVVVSFLTTIITMSFYLILDWDRYYVPLVLFFTLFAFIPLSAAAQIMYRILHDVLANTKTKWIGCTEARKV